MAQKQIQNVSWWHESLIDWMVANPDSTLGEAAKFFGVSQSWLSVIIRSDVFKARFAERMDQHRTLMSRNIAERLTDITTIALEEVERRMVEEMDTITFAQLQSATELMLKCQGYTARSPGAVQISAPGGRVQIANFGTVDPAVYARAREAAEKKARGEFNGDEERTGEATLEMLPAPSAS